MVSTTFSRIPRGFGGNIDHMRSDEWTGSSYGNEGLEEKEFQVRNVTGKLFPIWFHYISRIPGLGNIYHIRWTVLRFIHDTPSPPLGPPRAPRPKSQLGMGFVERSPTGNIWGG